MERLVLLLEKAQGAATLLTPPDLYLVNRGEAAERAALGLARALRQRGLAVELDSSGSAFAKQFKRADRSGATWAAVIGEGELEQGVVRLQPLRQQAAGEQTLALDNLKALQTLLFRFWWLPGTARLSWRLF
jgi:histidyl-tRNA synthetase